MGMNLSNSSGCTLFGVGEQEVHASVIPGKLLNDLAKDQELGKNRIRKLVTRSLGQKL